jgi:hypothetical protein
MVGTRAIYWRLLLKVSAPATATLAAWAIVQFFLLSETKFRIFDNVDAPENTARLIGIAAVIALNLVSAVTISDLTRRVEPGVRFSRYLRRRMDALTIVALGTVGAAFAVLDMTFCFGEHAAPVLIALAIGFLAVTPLLFERQIGVKRLLLIVAFFGVFTCWIAIQRNIDWNMRRHFLRAYAQLHPGMTAEQVDDVMRKNFPGKRPFARFYNSGVHYTLDPDDARFDSESINVTFVHGKLAAADYVHE